MRTNLSTVMKALLNGILDPFIYHGGDYSNVNQLTFFTSVLPLYFLNSPENQQILQTNKSNSSRISNLFTRQLDPKRKEPKFRDRFVSSFDEYFIDDMLLSSRFLLRNYNKDAFDKWIHTLLLTDVDMLTSENLFFYRNISSNYNDKPHLALTLIILWAFHVDDFKPLIAIFEQHPILNTHSKSSHSITQSAYQPIVEMLQNHELSVNDVYDFLEIAVTYGICSEMGAIAIKTYVDTHTHNNPLISSELADMYFYGLHFQKEQLEKALKLYTENANMNLGSSLWTLGVLCDNETTNIDNKPIQMALHYYDRAIMRKHANSYNNIGKWWLRALHIYLDKVIGLPNIRNIYANQGRQAVTDIYNIMIAKTEFVAFLESFGLHQAIEFETLTIKRKEHLLELIDEAENYIVDQIIMQAYHQQKYFYALSTCLTLYENQLSRRAQLAATYDLTRNLEKEAIIKKRVVYYVTEYAKFQVSESQFKYAQYLEDNHADEQTIYEYLYKAVYETPGNKLNYEALLSFLSYHKNPRVIYKKNNIYFEKSVLESISNYKLNYQSKSRHMYRAVNLILLYFTPVHLNLENYEMILYLLKAESDAHPDVIGDYRTLYDTFKSKFKSCIP